MLRVGKRDGSGEIAALAGFRVSVNYARSRRRVRLWLRLTGLGWADGSPDAEAGGRVPHPPTPVAHSLIHRRESDYAYLDLIDSN